MNNKGFTMLELLVASFILIVGVVGVYLAFSKIITVTSFVSSRLTASYLAQEGIEIVRNIRDSNWLADKENWKELLAPGCENGCEIDYKTGTPDDGGLTTLPPYTIGTFLSIDQNIDQNGFYTYSCSPLPCLSATKFKRQITITLDLDNDDILHVISKVLWSDKGTPYNVEVKEDLYNWK